MSTFNYPVHFKGTNIFADNIGPCLYVRRLQLCARKSHTHALIVCSITMSTETSSSPCPVKVSEALVEVSGDMLWMGNNAPKIGGAIQLTSHAQLRLHPSANLTFVSNNGM